MSVADRHAHHARDRARVNIHRRFEPTRAETPRGPCRRSPPATSRRSWDRSRPAIPRWSSTPGRAAPAARAGSRRGHPGTAAMGKAGNGTGIERGRLRTGPVRGRARRRWDAEVPAQAGPARCRPGARHLHSSCRRRAAARRRPSARPAGIRRRSCGPGLSASSRRPAFRTAARQRACPQRRQAAPRPRARSPFLIPAGGGRAAGGRTRRRNRPETARRRSPVRRAPGRPPHRWNAA